MNMETYEETRIPRDESWAKYLKEGSTVALLVWNNKVQFTILRRIIHCSVQQTGAKWSCLVHGVFGCALQREGSAATVLQASH